MTADGPVAWWAQAMHWAPAREATTVPDGHLEWRTTDPGQLAKAAAVTKPPKPKPAPVAAPDREDAEDTLWSLLDAS